MMLFDISDGSFSGVLEKASSDAREGSPRSVFNALSSLVQAEYILASVKAGLWFPGQKKADALKEKLCAAFQGHAEGLFQETWDSAARQDLGKSRQLTTRLAALRVLSLARDTAPPDTTSSQFLALYEAYASRLAIVEDAALDVPELARARWEKDEREAAVDVLVAGMVFHETARAPEDEGQECRALLDRYARQLSEDLIKQAGKERDPVAAEKLAVRALKVSSAGKGTDARLVPMAWGFAYRTLGKRLSDIRQKTHGGISRHSVDQNLSLLRDSFWFLPTQLEKPYREVAGGLARRASAIFLEESSLAGDLFAKLRVLGEGRQITEGFLEPDDPLVEKFETLQVLHKDLDAIVAKAQKLSEAHLHEDVARQARKASLLVKKVSRSTGEKLFAPQAARLEALAREGEKAMAGALERLEKAKAAGLTGDGWRLAAKALEDHPRLSPARDFIAQAQKSLALTGKALEIRMPGKKLRWFPREVLSIARGGPDINLGLQTLSVMPKRVEFYWQKKRAAVVDHGSSNGVFLKVANRQKGDISVMGEAYRRIPPGFPRPLVQQGELLIGSICRVAWRVLGTGLLLEFLEPYPPENVIPDAGELAHIWPGWERETSFSAIMAPTGFALEGTEKMSPVAGQGAIYFKRAGQGFVAASGGQPLEVWGVRVKKAPVMKGAQVRAGNIPLEFAVI